MELNIKIEFQLLLTADEIRLLVLALYGRLEVKDQEKAEELAIFIQTKRKEKYETAINVLQSHKNKPP